MVRNAEAFPRQPTPDRPQRRQEGSAMQSHDRDSERGKLLSEINVELSARNLKTLAKLGDATKGEIELTGLMAIYEHSKRFFYDFKFTCVFPNGKPGEFALRFNANSAKSDGAVIAAIINGKFAIVKQWRPVLCRWTYEIPRGFGEKMDEARIAGTLGTMKIGDLPLGTMARELGEEVMNAAEITSITHLGNVAQNSGTDAVAPSFFLVAISVEESILSKRLKGADDEISQVFLWDADTVEMEVGRRLVDGHTLMALKLIDTYKKRMSGIL